MASRKKIYHSIEELQADLGQWLVHYNDERTYTGKYFFWRMPYQTFQETNHLSKEKTIDILISLPGSEP